MSDKFLTKSEFSKLVEKNVLDKKMSYMEAVLMICEDHGIDPEDVRKFVSAPIQEKIEGEAMRLNLIPRSNELFFD
jgi:UDP-glucose 6-dehydrogenase